MVCGDGYGCRIALTQCCYVFLGKPWAREIETICQEFTSLCGSWSRIVRNERQGGLLGVPRYGVFERTSCLRHKKKTVTGSRVGKKASTTLYRPAGKPSKHYIGDVWQCSDQQQSVDPAKS